MIWKGCFAIAILLIAGARADAQTWPTRPIEVIVPFPAGGSVDVVARAVASALSEKLHQQVVVNNRVGASGTTGFNALASAAPDGYTLGAGPTTPIANAPYLVKGVRYNVNSFDYICHVFENPFTITVAPDSKFKSIKELLDAAAANPGKLSYGHSGNGTIPHLSVANLADALKSQVSAGAVSRRKRHHAGAAQGRHRFWRLGRGLDPWSAVPPARRVCRPASSGAAGNSDGA